MAVTGAKVGGGKTGVRKKGIRRVDHLAAARMLQEYLGTRGTL
jgi:hypothetical protein